MEINLLGRNDGGKRVVSPNSNAHDDSPEDENSGDGDSWGGSRKGLGQSRKDDDHQLDAVHALAAITIGKIAKEQLTDDGATGSRDFEGCVGVGWKFTGIVLCILPVDHAEHAHAEVNGEDIVGIGEETHAGDHDGA